MRSFSLVIAASLLLACQPPPPKAEAEAEPSATPAAAPKPEPDPSCTSATLEAELRSYCDYDVGVPPVALPKVAWEAESYHPLATRVITLDAAGITDPEGSGSHGIAQWLADPPRRLPEPGEMVFAIAADVPAEQVAELFAGLQHAGRERIRVLVHVAQRQPVPQPRKPEMLAELLAALPADANERVMYVANGMGQLAHSCAGLGGVFPQLVQVPPGDRCARLAELAAATLSECGCPQLPEIMTMLYALTIGFEVPPGRAAAVELELDPAQVVSIEPGLSWGALAQRTLTTREPLLRSSPL